MNRVMGQLTAKDIVALTSQNVYLKASVSAFRDQNAKLQKQIAKLEATAETSKNRIRELEQRKDSKPSLPVDPLELAKNVLFLLRKADIDINGRHLSKKKRSTDPAV